MVKIEEEPHWHLPEDQGFTEIELVANYHDDVNDSPIPLTIMQGDESVWFSREQAEALVTFIQEKVFTQ